MTHKNINISKLKQFAVSAVILLSVSLVPTIGHTQAEEPWTGSVVGATINLGNAGTLIQIRSLLNKGKAELAVTESRKFIKQLARGSRGGKTSRFTYEAYNALCISLTTTGAFDEAMEACNTAIDINESRWQAINSRGSLHYKSGKYQEALADYRRAYELAPELERFNKVIEHNIKIAEAKATSG